MLNDAERFRGRAKDCRRLAADASNVEDRRILSEMADELDAEADRIEAEDARPEGA